VFLKKEAVSKGSGIIGNSIAIVAGSAAAFWSNQPADTFWTCYLPLLLVLSVLRSDLRLLSIFFTMFLWASLQIHFQLQQRLDEKFDGRVVELSGRIADIPDQRKDAIRFLVVPDHIKGYTQTLPGKIRLSWYRSKQLPQAGERWHLLVKLRQPGGSQNPGGFDYERWQFVKGIGASGYVKNSIDNQKLSDAPWWHINRYRVMIAKAIQRSCPGCQHNGLFQALTIGYRGAINSHQRQLLQDTATAHLLAISGLHIGLVATLFYGLGRRLWSLWFYRRGFNRLEFSASLAIIAAIFYAALAGFSIPTVRALVMLGVVFVALLCRCGINLLNSIAIAVALILAIDPLAIASSSLWLSVSALLVIAFTQFLLPTQSNWLKQIVILQLLFSLLFIPISLLIFGQASPAGFLANIIAIPLLSLVILPLVLFATLLAVFDVPGVVSLFGFIDMVTGWLMGYLGAIINFGPDVYHSSQAPMLLILFAGTGLLLLLLPVNNAIRKAALLLLLLPVFWRAEKIERGGYRLTVLDVGMGTSVFLETRHHSLTYDFGPGNDSGFSAGNWALKPYLQYRGIDRADLMIVSHVDRDHSGGFISFLANLDYTRLLSGTPRELAKRFKLKGTIRSCHDFPPWQWDGVGFEFLSVDTTKSEPLTNNRSCVLLIKSTHRSLLSGDIEAHEENRLLSEMPDKLVADILLVPHHGSLTSSTEAFIKQVSPQIAVFTLGRGNRWGFPKKEVVRRYQEQGSQIYRSDLHGAVTLNIDGESLNVESFRQINHRLWQIR